MKEINNILNIKTRMNSFSDYIAKSSDVTEDMLNDLNILKEVNQDDHNKIVEIWLKKCTYDHFRYLMGKFIEGELQCNYMHGGPLDDDHIDSKSALIKLNNKNIITFMGQRSYIQSLNVPPVSLACLSKGTNNDFVIHIQRSNLNFLMKVTPEFDPILFGQKLYDKGMEVFMVKFNPINNNYTTKEYAFSDNLEIKGETTYKNVCKIIRKNKHKFNDQWAITKGSINWKSFESYTWSAGHLMLELCNNQIKIISNFEPANYCAIEIFSKNWDNLQCDEVLLEILE